MTPEQEREAMDALRFVKVIVDRAHMTDQDRAAGYLSEVSCKMLMVELARNGLAIAAAGGR